MSNTVSVADVSEHKYGHGQWRCLLSAHEECKIIMSYRVCVRPGGACFEASADETILEAALRQGHVLRYGCRGGSCGSCKGRVLVGKIDHGHTATGVLSDADRSQGLALFCQAQARSDLEIEASELAAVAGIPIRTLPCRVAKMTRLAHDVMGLSLKLPQEQHLRYLAGQYIDILLKEGGHRSFSIANAPLPDDHLTLELRLVPDGVFTPHVFEHMAERDLLRIRGPMGTFYLREDELYPIIFVAGGTGIAPIKAILEHFFGSGMTRPVHLYWGVRSSRDLYHDALLHQWAERYASFSYTPVLSSPDGADQWDGKTGHVHEVLAADYPDLSWYSLYASGPPKMVDAVAQVARARRLPPERFYSDSFENAATLSMRD